MRRILWLGAVTATVLIVGGLSPAHADTMSSGSADAIAAAVAEAAPIEVNAADLEAVAGGVAASLEGGGEAVLATDPTSGVEVRSADGAEALSFSLPGAGALDDAVVADDGSVTYLGDASTPSINIVAAEDAIRVSTIIEAPSQAERFSYDFGAGATVEIQADGGAVAYVIDPVTNPETGETMDAEKIIANVDAPWAADANGAAVVTHYEASGSVLNSKPKRCVQITATQPYVFPGLVWWVDTYSGGPCR